MTSYCRVTAAAYLTLKFNIKRVKMYTHATARMRCNFKHAFLPKLSGVYSMGDRLGSRGDLFFLLHFVSFIQHL